MRKIYIVLLVLCMPMFAYGQTYTGGGGGTQTDSDCNQVKYFALGTLCQDTDDGKLYKGTGAAVEEIAEASGDGAPTDAHYLTDRAEGGLSAEVVVSTIGKAVATSTNPGAITFGRANADNTFSWLSASDFRTAIGVIDWTVDQGATNIHSGNIPTLNQSTSGSAASLSISGQTGLVSFTGLTSTNRIKTVRDAADTILELGGSYTPTGTWNWTSATWSNVPTLNQSTTGNAATASALASDPSDCSEGQFANAIAANGNLTCATPSGSGFSVTDITGQTDDTTPATTATAVLAQGGSLIESTLGQIGTAIGVIDWTADQGATNIHSGNIPDLSGTYLPLWDYDYGDLINKPTIPAVDNTPDNGGSDAVGEDWAYDNNLLTLKKFDKSLLETSAPASPTQWGVYYPNGIDWNPASRTQATITGSSDITFVSGTPCTITDAGEGFVTAGFEVGNYIKVEDTTSNNGYYIIVGVAAGTLTLEASETLTDEADTSATITGAFPYKAIYVGTGYIALEDAGGNLIVNGIGTGSVNAVKENGTQVGGSDIATLDFLGADFVITETPDTEINIAIDYTNGQKATNAVPGFATAAQITALEAIDTEEELEALLEVADLQGKVAVSQIPDNLLIPNSDTLPATCTVGERYYDIDADTDGELYVCRATDTWKAVDDDGGAGGMVTTDIDTSSELATIVTNETGSSSGTPLLVFNQAPRIDDIELGDATDTTIHRESAGVVSIEGNIISRTIASGTSALGTSEIASGACAAAVTTTATGTATTDIIGWGFNGDPTSTTGYSASADGMLTIISYPTSNNVNFKVCNNTASSVTPGAITLNWKVIR